MNIPKGFPAVRQYSARKLIFAIIGIIILFGFAVYGFSLYRTFLDTAAIRARVIIPQSELQEKYGLNISLVAVTAGGGMVDVRLKFLAGAKARNLLQDAGSFPTVWVPRKGVTLQMSEADRPQKIQFDDNGNLFLLYPNAGSAVKSGDMVNLVFGNVQLEPIQVR